MKNDTVKRFTKKVRIGERTKEKTIRNESVMLLNRSFVIFITLSFLDIGLISVIHSFSNKSYNEIILTIFFALLVMLNYKFPINFLQNKYGLTLSENFVVGGRGLRFGTLPHSVEIIEKVSNLKLLTLTFFIKMLLYVSYILILNFIV